MVIKAEVLIVGGGFAGVSVAQALERHGVHTILVDKKDYFEVTFATLRNVTDPSSTENQARKYYRDFFCGRFIQGDVVEMSAKSAHLADGTELHFDSAILASGTRYPNMSMAKSISAMDIQSRNQELLDVHQRLKQARKVMVIGGGVVGVELAGEIAHAMPITQVILAHNKDVLLDNFKPKAQIKAQRQLENLGVEIQFNSRYQYQNGCYIDLNNGQASGADLVFEATGVLPNNDYLKPHLAHILNEQGFVKVDNRLQVIDEPSLYALGDIADVGEAKLGYLASQQGEYLAKAIARNEKGKSTKSYKRSPLMALIPVGQKQGLVQLPFAVTTCNHLVRLKQKDLFINKVYRGFGTQPNARIS
ncbi:hypothetical protein BTJ40_09150 [Microbulbifer sp. A4B17]|uniref:NAD(P)/FAD-dependent oxidoreductase n=1 Tax=Microbulbifer sp. A4B17 TaxID=359370 RepID=UPI000D52B623|nr:FAD-dependent oxidoreductase [Microbulbifer sp. A4B17]AWF80963.1 hypothetical protein BTJ40_09150 [Microbulbifer sp. A4B17]